MPEIEEVLLPGVGVRHEFTTAGGERLAVLTQRNGRREIAVHDRLDPDRSRAVVHLDEDDSRALAELLGATQLAESVTAVQQQVEGLAIEWVTITAQSRLAGRTIADGELRASTGASIVAIIRGDTTEPAPGPDAILDVGNVAVAVGRPEGLAQLRTLLTG